MGLHNVTYTVSEIMSEIFMVDNALKQDNPVLATLFKIVSKKIIRAMALIDRERENTGS